jgi:ribosomal protein S27AE
VTGTAAGQPPVYCDNPAEWDTIVARIRAAGHQVSMTPAGVTALVSAGVAAMFAADATGQFDGLHAMFADPIVANLARRAGEFHGAHPQSVTIHLIGPPQGHDPNEVRLRIRLSISAGMTIPPGASPSAPPPPPAPTNYEQFWDISQGQQITVNRPNCPNCGAPTSADSSVCRFCGADVRDVTRAVVSVVEVQLY